MKENNYSLDHDLLRRKRRVRQYFVFPLLVLMVFSPLFPVVAAESASHNDSSIRKGRFVSGDYVEFAREFRAVQLGKEYSGKVIPAEERQQRTRTLRASLEEYLSFERERLRTLDFPRARENEHFRLLESQIRALGGAPLLRDKLKQFAFGLINRASQSEMKTIIGDDREIEPAIPLNPGSFTTTKDPHGSIIDLEDIIVRPQAGQRIPEDLRNLVSIQPAFAGAIALPTLEEVQGDASEAVISPEIQELAERLNRNPVEIYSYVFNTIRYELYAGAKKGSVGCLKERVCNDTDTSSLLIALLRASGIPAHYKKSLVLVSVENLKQLIGVDETKTVYYAFSRQGVPLALINDIGQEDFETADFSKVRYMALEWTFAEAYVLYDERGAHFENPVDVSTAESTAEVQKAFSVFPKFQWLPLDAAFKPVTREKKEVVTLSDFNYLSIIEQFLRAGGTERPLAYYDRVVSAQKGKSPFAPQSRSRTQPVLRTFSILPPSLPYIQGFSGSNESTVIEPETWTTLPDSRRLFVTLSLTKDGGSEPIFAKKFFGSQINNQDITLTYEGATEEDRTEIEKAGGIHASLGGLVKIRPVMLVQTDTFVGESDVGIGDRLVLRFGFGRGDKELYFDEKFSVAGNFEGIVITLSRVQGFDKDGATEIIKRGNAGFARAYLERVYASSVDMAESLDHRFEFEFARAVVTQNRILAKDIVSGQSTTFDFSGLTLDASAVITNYGARGSYATHQDIFRTLFGLEPSYQEGKIFSDIAGLDGISTVQGIQYAVAKPAEYSLVTINASNISEIDALSQSSQTKKYIRNEIEKKQATVFIPSRKLERDGWKGTVYLVVYPDFTGIYAIGEQVMSNGGATTNRPIVAKWWDEKDRIQLSYEVQNGGQRFLYKDRYKKPAHCRISDVLYTNIVNGKTANGWNLKLHGKPCYDEGPFRFGKHDHYAVFATDGAYFQSSANRYDSWMQYITAEAMFEETLGSIPFNHRWVGSYYGTYAYHGIVDRFGFAGLIMYNPEAKKMITLGGKMMRQYITDEKILGEYVPYLLGFPTTPSDNAAPYEKTGTKGWYQQFTNGTLYQRNDTFTPDNTFVVVGKINEKHTAEQGTWKMGFPTQQPYFSSSGDSFFQTFENGKKIRYTPASDTVVIDDNEIQSIAFAAVPVTDEEKRIFMEGFLDTFYEMGVTDVYSLFASALGGAAFEEATERVIKGLAPKLAKKAGLKGGVLVVGRFVPLAGWVLLGGTSLIAANANKPTYDACKADKESLIDGAKPLYYCGKLGAYGTAAVIGAGSMFAVNRATNAIGMASSLSRQGKVRLLQRVTSEQQGAMLVAAGKTNPRALEKTSEVIAASKMSDAQIDEIIQHPGAFQLAIRYGLLSFPRMAFLPDKSDALKKTFQLTDAGDIALFKALKEARDGQTPQQIGKAGEEYWKRFVSGGKRTFPIFDPSIGKRRFVDVNVYDDGTHTAYEVKFYKDEVLDSKRLREEIEKDVYLGLNRQDGYRPVWVFLDKGPSEKLEKLLRDASLEYVIMIP